MAARFAVSSGVAAQAAAEPRNEVPIEVVAAPENVSAAIRNLRRVVCLSFIGVVSVIMAASELTIAGTSEQ